MHAVTTKTTAARTAPMELPQEGMKRTRTLLSVSPTTTLYEIIATTGMQYIDFLFVLKMKNFMSESNLPRKG